MKAEQFIHKYYDDFQAADWQAFGSHLSEDFTYYTDQCIVQSKEELLQFLAANAWPVKQFEISDFSTLSGSNENLCVVTYKIAFHSSDDTTIVLARESTVLRGKGDAWEVCHCHSSNKI